MVQFNTGNQAWDQGLNSLSGSLFPDPSKTAMAGYYGAEMRNAQLNEAVTRSKLANTDWLLNAATDPSHAPGMSFHPSPAGINMPLIMDDPNATGPTPQAQPFTPQTPQPMSATVPGQPPQAPPQAQTPPQQGQPASPPPASPPGAPMSATVPGNGPAPPAAPTTPAATATAAGGRVVGQGPNGGAIVQPTMSPGQVADATPKIFQAVQQNTATPPPTADTPAPGSGAPAAPNTTGTNGSVPAGAAISSVFHPGSITDPGGGRKATGPANPNGSPAQLAITPAMYVAHAIASGQDAAQAVANWRAYIDSLYQKGMLDEAGYHHAMGSADPSIINTDTQARSAANVAGIQAGSAANVANITQTGETTRTGMTPVFVPDPTNPQTGRYLPTSQFQTPGGVPGYNQTAVPEAVKPQLVLPPGAPPNAQPSVTTTQQAQVTKAPAYTPGTADIAQTQGGAYGTFEDPKVPGSKIFTTSADATARGLVPFGTGVPAPLLPNPAFQLEAGKASDDQTTYQQPKIGPMDFTTVDKPVAFSPTAQNLIKAREQVLLSNKAVQQNPIEAHHLAVNQLIAEGQLENPDQVNKNRQGMRIPGTADARLVQAPNYDKAGTSGPHMMVRATSELRNQPAQPQPQPKPPQGPPPGALGTTTQPDGARVKIPGTNTFGVARGGFVFPPGG